MDQVSIEIIKGESKKTGKQYEAISLKIGDWSSLVFPRSKFEMDYIKSIIED